MKNSYANLRTILLTSLTIIVLLVSCSKSVEPVVNPPSETDLITNGSFERNSLPSLEGWTSSTTDTSFINFSTDVPPGGGSYSVRLRNEWGFPGAVWQTIVPSSGTHRYRLSASGKAVRLGARAGGRMSIRIKQDTVWSTTKWFHFSDTTWTSTTLLDTLTTVPGDTIEVGLSGNIDQWSSGYVLFDVVKFERLD